MEGGENRLKKKRKGRELPNGRREKKGRRETGVCWPSTRKTPLTRASIEWEETKAGFFPKKEREEE